jgi:hypothetical protein
MQMSILEVAIAKGARRRAPTPKFVFAVSIIAERHNRDILD